MKKESAIVSRIIAAVRARYPTAYVRKLSDRFQRGLPDILIIHRGKVLMVEAKTPTGKLSQLQRIEGREIAIAGGAWMIATCVDDVLLLLGQL